MKIYIVKLYSKLALMIIVTSVLFKMSLQNGITLLYEMFEPLHTSHNLCRSLHIR